MFKLIITARYLIIHVLNAAATFPLVPLFKPELSLSTLIIPLRKLLLNLAHNTPSLVNLQYRSEET